MKMYSKYIVLGLISVTLFFVSCNDTILDKQPLTEISENDVWTDPALVQAFVNARYNRVGHGWTEGWQSSNVDETALPWSRGCEPINQGYINPSDLGRMNGGWWGWDHRSWGTVWGQVTNCNIFFERIGSVPFPDATLKTRLKGEVRFIRALMYHDLVARWGAMPLITKSYTLKDVDKIKDTKRATYKECIDFIVSQLDSAAAELPASYSGTSKGRATSVAALALKSRVLLYAASDLMNIGVKDPTVGYTTPDPKRWEKAATAAQACIDAALTSGYTLYDKYGDDVKTKYIQLFLECGNSEVLFDREGTTSANSENLSYLDQSNGPNGYGQWGGNCPISEFVDAFEMADGTKFDWTNPVHKADPFSNRDPRLHATVLCDGDKWMTRNVEAYINADASGNELTTGGRDSKYGGDAWNTSLTGYYTRKFMDETYSPNSWNFKNPKNWIWLRLGEQYLNLAEALYMSGNEVGARNALNAIRDRARMPRVTDAGSILLDRIRNERRVELCFEEHRYFDVRRWKLGDQYLNKTVTGISILKKPDGTKIYNPGKIVEQRKFSDKMNWLPILKSEIDKNSNLIQNPGY